MSAIISQRYAKSFFDLSVEKNILSSTMNDLNELADCLSQAKTFESFMHDPTITNEDFSSIIDQLFKDKVSAETLCFLKFLNKKSRIYLLNEIIDNFRKLYEKENNILNLLIETAHPLSQKEETQIQEKLKQKLKKEVTFTLKVNEKLYGGMRIYHTNQLYDLSLSSQLNQYKKQLIGI